jgi:DNA-binding transcriptional regulator YdaS (Cro superfamily)
VGVIAIVHTQAEGTVVWGTALGDGANTVLRPAGFRWYTSQGAWGIVGSRDQPPQLEVINRAVAALRAAGFTVTVDLDDAASTAAGEVAGRSTASAQMLVGRAVVAAGRAAAVERAARAAVQADAVRRSPSAVRQRLERLAAAQRHDQRALEGYRRTIRNGGGVTEDQGPATGAWRTRLINQMAQRQKDVEYWTAVADRQYAMGIATDYAAAGIAAGDAVKFRGRWYPVTRVNAKSVTVKKAAGTGTISYRAIGGHRPAANTGE